MTRVGGKKSFSAAEEILMIIIDNSGKIHYTEVFDMLKAIDPPLGFGKKCPERQAYKKLIRMNMPMDKEGKVRDIQATISQCYPIPLTKLRLQDIQSVPLNLVTVFFSIRYFGKNMVLIC